MAPTGQPAPIGTPPDRISIHLLDFLRTGEFGGVRIGMERAEIVTLLGPFDWEADDKNGLNIALHGDFEFHFEGEKLWLIHLDNFRGRRRKPAGGPRLDLNPWIIREGLRRSDFKQALREQGIRFARVPSPSPDCLWLRLTSGVTVIFRVRPTYGSCSRVGLAALSGTFATWRLPPGARRRVHYW